MYDLHLAELGPQVEDHVVHAVDVDDLPRAALFVDVLDDLVVFIARLDVTRFEIQPPDVGVRQDKIVDQQRERRKQHRTVEVRAEKTVVIDPCAHDGDDLRTGGKLRGKDGRCQKDHQRHVHVAVVQGKVQVIRGDLGSRCLVGEVLVDLLGHVHDGGQDEHHQLGYHKGAEKILQDILI